MADFLNLQMAVTSDFLQHFRMDLKNTFTKRFRDWAFTILHLVLNQSFFFEKIKIVWNFKALKCQIMISEFLRDFRKDTACRPEVNSCVVGRFSLIPLVRIIF